MALVVVGAGSIAAACAGHGSRRAASVAHAATKPAAPPRRDAIERATVRVTVPTRPAGPVRWRVARAVVTLVDATRSTPPRGAIAPQPRRVLRTTLRWPVSAAQTLPPGPRPLIVFAHGFAVDASTYDALLDDLARDGFVVAAPDLPGESTAYPGPPNETDLANEPCDLAFVASSLEVHPPGAIASLLRHAPLIFAGHSDGATAAAAAAYASTCGTVAVRGVVALSADRVPMTHAAHDGFVPPLLAVTGAADEVNPVAHTVALYEAVPSRAWLVTVAGGRHLSTFTDDPARSRVAALISAFVSWAAGPRDGTPGLTRFGDADVHISSR